MEIKIKDEIKVKDNSITLVNRDNILLGRYLIDAIPASARGRNTNIVMLKNITILLRCGRQKIIEGTGRLLIRMFKDDEGQEDCLTLELKVGKRLFDLQKILERYEGKIVDMNFTI